MDLRESRVQLSRPLDRMHVSTRFIPVDQRGHFSRQMHEIRRGCTRTRDHHVFAAIPARFFSIDALQP
ncbi:hypothetical protein WJ15_01260 [Burkholderia cepacia]|nr:hypothetical protein WJ15_01260 [Burkholderia cepacia]